MNAEQLRQRWIRELEIAFLARDWPTVKALLIDMKCADLEESESFGRVKLNLLSPNAVDTSDIP